jgi:ribosome biogenesis SPOUT family RNA methylase Rps3
MVEKMIMAEEKTKERFPDKNNQENNRQLGPEKFSKDGSFRQKTRTKQHHRHG